MVAERVRDTQFGNIHQSSLSIPDVAILKKIQKQQHINSWGKAEAGDQFLNLLIFSINIGQVVPGAASPPSCVQPAHLKFKKTREEEEKKEKASASAQQTPVCTGAARSGSGVRPVRRKVVVRERGERKKQKKNLRKR